MQNRLDEKFDQLIDSLCVAVPKHLNRLYRRIARTHLGWHILAFFSSAGRNAGIFLRHFSSDEEMNRFLSGLPGRFLSETGYHFHRPEEQAHNMGLTARGLRFRLLLVLLALAAFGTVFSPGRDMAAYVLSLAFSFLGCAVSLPYRPLAGNLRQTWVEGRLLSSASFVALLLHWFREYMQYGIASNIFLQGAMMIALILHFSVYLAAIAFNARQHIFLRLLDGLTGILPALAAAAATSLLPAAFGSGETIAVFVCACGAWMLFVSDRIESVRAIGGLSIPYASLTTGILSSAGYVLLLISAWRSG